MTETLSNPVFRPIDPYVSAFERLFAAEQDRTPDWISKLRQNGFMHYQELGLPGPDHEEWRFTNISPLASRPTVPILVHTHPPLTMANLQPWLIPGLECNRLVFIDGHYSAQLSEIKSKAEGLKICSLARAMTIKTALVEPHLGRHAQATSQAFVALNTAFFQDGAFIWVPAGLALVEPVHLLFISTVPETGASIHPRNLILVQRDARLQVIETYAQLKEGENLTNTVTEIVAGPNARVEHCKYQCEGPQSYHLAAIQIHQEAHSETVSHSISLGGRLARNDIQSHFAGAGGNSLFNGLYLAGNDQLTDHHTVIDHAQPHCGSHEFYNGILHGRGRGVFNGKIFVRPGAQKTEAKQTNRNLVLSDEAVIDTKPQLEIFADDVKCTHGATVGQLDSEALFYLQSRGIGRDLARQMLMHAFAQEIIDRVGNEPLRDYLDARVQEQLAAIPLPVNS